MSRKEIAELNYIEYQEALNYSVNTYKLRNMAVDDKKSKGDKDHIPFVQEPDFDIDPNFISDVGKPR